MDDDLKVTKKDDKLIDDLAKTKAVREMARVMLSYLSIEEVAQLISTFIFFTAKGGEGDEAFKYFVKDQFFPLLRATILMIGDLIPDLLIDSEFIKLLAKIGVKRFSLRKLFD